MNYLDYTVINSIYIYIYLIFDINSSANNDYSTLRSERRSIWDACFWMLCLIKKGWLKVDDLLYFPGK